METPLCEICRSISFDAMRYAPGFNHHDRAWRLEQEANKPNGCHLCSLLWEALVDASDTINVMDIEDDDSIRLLLNPPGSPIDSCSITKSQPSQMYSIVAVCGTTENLDRLRWAGEEPDAWSLSDERDAVVSGSGSGSDSEPDSGSDSELEIKVVVQAELRLVGCPGDPCAHLFRYRQIIIDSASEESFALVKKWVNTCENSHKSCQITPGTTLPHRLLDVGPADGSKDPHLLTLNNEDQVIDGGGSSHGNPRYIALSYCWGKEPTLTTTQKNLHVMEAGISLDILPRTIRDAVIITRKLGVRYLWVDALCILQGTDDASRKDWEIESPKMADVYSGAYLTIAAALSPNTRHGIFSLRPEIREASVMIPYSATCTPTVSGKVSLNDVTSILTQRVHGILNEPLYQRAWTLQERILSWRVLTFTTNQLAWECQSALLTESGDDLPIVGSTRLKSFVSAYNWHTIIRDYTMRNLTYGDDKLPALSGLVKALSARSGDTYIAGLWKSTFLDDLLWVHQHMVIGNETKRSRPEKFRAPSWSWASIDGNVWYPGDFTKETRYFSDIIDYHFVARGPNPFGELVEGWVMLEADIKQAWIGHWDNGKDGKEKTSIFEFNQGEAGANIGGIWLDMDGMPGFDPLDVWALRVRGDEGLLVTHEDQTKSAYRRLGVFTLRSNGNRWFESSQKLILTIV